MLLLISLATAKKVALVIGNGDYGQGFLPNPTKDADLIAQNLRDVGFSVTVKKNLSTAYQMEKAIDDFAGIVKDDDIAVIYYAGHGVQCKGKNYLIPTKATINRGGQLPSKALNLELVIGAVSDIKLAIIMLDACRNNTYPSCKAVITVRELWGEDVAFNYLGAIQKAFYAEGQDITSLDTLTSYVIQNKKEFLDFYTSKQAEQLMQHDFTKARSIGANAFPSTIKIDSEGHMVCLNGYRPLEEILKI